MASLEYGGSCLISRSTYYKYIYNNRAGLYGHPAEGVLKEALFLTSKEEMDALLEAYPYNRAAWEKALGLEPDSLGQLEIYRVDVDASAIKDARIPQFGVDAGATDKCTGTGELPGIDGIEMHEWAVAPVENPGFNPEVGSVTQVDEPIMFRTALGAGQPDEEEDVTVEVRENVTVETEIDVDVETQVETHTSVGPDGDILLETNVETTTTVTETTEVTRTTEIETTDGRNDITDGRDPDRDGPYEEDGLDL